MSDKANKHELYRALGLVMKDALKNKHRAAEKEDEAKQEGNESDRKYWRKQRLEAHDTWHYCFIRQMQISPD